MDGLERWRWWAGGGGGTTEMPAVPINHSPPVIDSANAVWERPGKLEGINQGTPKTFHPSQLLNQSAE